MAIEAINLNNQLISADASGVCDLSSVIREHQDLSEYMPKSMIQYVSAVEWETLSATADPDVYYFVGE